jgi:hypothetical protein
MVTPPQTITLLRVKVNLSLILMHLTETLSTLPATWKE